MKRYKQALLITAYENVDELISLLEIYNLYFACYVHIDKKCNIKEEQWEKLQSMISVTVISKYKIYWGSYKHILAILSLIELACQDNCNYMHVISANTLPIRNPNKIIQFYDKNLEFIFMETKCREQLTDEEAYYAFDYRYKAYFFHDIFNVRTKLGNGKLRIIMQKTEKFLTPIQIRLNIRKHPGYKYKGYVYCHFPFEAAKEVLSYVCFNREYIKGLKRCYVGEEFFFQNIFMNTDWRNKVKNDCRIYDIWGEERGYPAFLGESDYKDLLETHCDFARKFRPNSKLFEMVRKHECF